MKRCLTLAILLAAVAAICLEFIAPAEAVMTRRYSFTADGSDSLGGAAWMANGGASFGSGQVNLDGVDDFLSLAATPLPTSGSMTIEVWGTYDPATAVGSRIFDFSTATGAGFMYLTPRATPNTPVDPQQGSDPAQEGSNTRWRWIDDATLFPDIGPMAATVSATGQEVLFTLVFDSSTPAGVGQFLLYRDGSLIATDSAEGLPILGAPLSGTTSNRLGGGTSVPPGTGVDLPAFLTGSINEFRVYNNVLDPVTILTNLISGPDVTSVSFTDKTWNGTDSDWNTAGNWAAAGVPGTANRALINGGTANVTAAAPQAGALTMTAGTLSIGSGGSLDVKYPIQLNTGAAGTATINVTGGGVLAIGGILPEASTGTKTINIDGGVIRPGSKTALVNAGTTTVIGAGGATFDTPGSDTISWATSLSGSGDVTKTGTGTLVLRPPAAMMTLETQNPNYSGEVYVNEGALDIQREHGVLGTAGVNAGGKVHLNNATLVINTAYPLPQGFRKEVPVDIVVDGETNHSFVRNMVDRAGTEIRLQGTLTGNGTLEFIKPSLGAPLGLDFENRDVPAPILPVDNSGFTGRIIANGNWAIRMRGELIDPDMVPMSGDEVLYDKMDLPNAVLQIIDPDGLGARVGKRTTDPNQLVRIGGLDGGIATIDTVSGLVEFTQLQASIGTEVGAATGDVTFQLGGASQDADWAGHVRNGGDGDAGWPDDVVSIVKVGDNTQIFSGPNSYTGTTTVNGGTLLVNGRHSRDARQMFVLLDGMGMPHNGAPAPAVLNVADYTVNLGGTLGGTGFIGQSDDPVDVNVVGGTLNPGDGVGTLTVAGAVNFDAMSRFVVEISGTMSDLLIATALNISSGATLEIVPVGGVTAGQYPIFDVDSVSGMFNVVAPAGFSINPATGVMTAPNVSAGVLGDYNGNGTVDAADYTTWRDQLGQSTTLPNTDPNDTDGVVTQAEYNFWKSRFGATMGSGSSSLAAGSVPEPAACGLALVACVGALGTFRRRQ